MNLHLNCNTHKKKIEAFCEICNKLVCTQCIFNSTSSEHKGHSFLSLDDTALRIREHIEENIRLLKKEYTEEVELKIRYAKVEYKKAMQEFVTNVESVFDNLINKIKDRKKFLIKAIEEDMMESLKTFVIDEEKWKEKDKTAKKILELGTISDDATILLNLNEIKDGLDFLKEGLNTKYIPIYNDFKLNLTLKDELELEYKDLECLLSNMIVFEKPIYIEYRA